MSEAVAQDVTRAMQSLPDPRIRQFWDPANALGTGFQPILATPAEAWDVYLLYPPTAEWGAEFPKPQYWMHQLTALKSGERLDGDKLAGVVANLLR